MKDYTYAEIGMLIGLAIGGALAVVGFAMFSHALVFIIAGLGMATGIGIGSTVDKKLGVSPENVRSMKRRF